MNTPRSASLPRRPRRFAALAPLAIAALLVLPAAASAFPEPTLYETTGGNGHGTTAASNLYKVTPATGAATSVGSTGYSITGLAQDPTTGILYAVSNNNSPISPKTLLTLNPANGAATPVGSLSGDIIADITFNSQGQLFGWTESGDDLASIDKLTGAVTVIPSLIGTDGSGNSFDRNDTFWLFGNDEDGEFDTIDTITGAVTKRGTLQPIHTEASAVSAAAWDCTRTTLYATLNHSGEPPANLVTIDTATGAIANRGLTVTGADGLEWFCPLAFEFTSTAATVGPGGDQTLTLPLARGPRIKGAATVAFATKAGSARAGRDFTALSGVATFPNNVTEQPLALTVTPDPKAGKNRTFQVLLSSPSSGGTVGSPFTVTIKTAKPKLKVKGPKLTAKGVTFTLRSNEIPAKFRCKLDRGRFKSCGTSGKKGKKLKLGNLDAGTHKLQVQVVNGAGLKSKPLKKTFLVH